MPVIQTLAPRSAARAGWRRAWPWRRRYRVKMNAIRALSAIGLLLGLAACSRGDQAGSPVPGTEGPYCPRPTLVSDLQSSESRDKAGQVEWTARLAGLNATCDPMEFDYVIAMDVTIDLETGPAFKGGPVQLAYFVAVATESGQVIDKQTFPVVVEPARNEREVLRRETLRQRLPVKYQDQPAAYSILIGFEPTPQQVRDRTEPLPSVGAGASGSGQ